MGRACVCVPSRQKERWLVLIISDLFGYLACCACGATGPGVTAVWRPPGHVAFKAQSQAVQRLQRAVFDSPAAGSSSVRAVSVKTAVIGARVPAGLALAGRRAEERRRRRKGSRFY